MTRALLPILFLSACHPTPPHSFTELDEPLVPGFGPGYREFCQLRSAGGNPERLAVLSAFYGDYEQALEEATEDASVQQPPAEYLGLPETEEGKQRMRAIAEQMMNDPGKAEEARALLSILTAPATIEEAFDGARPVPAREYITTQARNYHFTLINEAHYSSQHRHFTQSLLQPLWEAGYRYLALETLSHQDTLLQERGYPVHASGYYTQDAHFGNTVREALAIGYVLVPYETQSGNRGTARDRDQARSIYRQTLQQDKEGKVLVHAGYGSINELGGSGYLPMGAQLKALAGQDILTIDQESMSALNTPEKLHHYYRFADSAFYLTQPTVFLDGKDKPVLGPVSKNAIDLQVYHPRTRFISGRPDWMVGDGKVKVSLPEKLQAYKGHLLRAIPRGEALDAVPVDQFIIDGKKPLLLPKGFYILQVIDCEGAMVKVFELEVGML